MLLMFNLIVLAKFYWPTHDDRDNFFHGPTGDANIYIYICLSIDFRNFIFILLFYQIQLNPMDWMK